jgi:phospho-N-acetylmuramoyl-pentapeptide-transferase
MVVSLLFWMDWSSSFTWILLITTVVLGSLGAIDDYLKLRYKNNKGLSARKKMLGQLLFSACLALYLLCPGVNQAISSTPPTAKEQIVKKVAGNVSIQTTSFTTSEYMAKFYLPFKKGALFTADGWMKIFMFFLIIFVVTGASNGVNLTDGLDGLAAGCLVMVSIVLALFAFLSNHMDLARYLHILYIDRSGEIAVYLFALAGGCLGFLWYNGYPAQVFMGDTGSLALGGILGVSSILLRRELILALAGAIFVAEAGSVILQVLSYRYRNKKRIFLCAPLHHHFEYKGWPETKVVVRFWIISLLFCMIAISSIKLQ